MPTHRKTLAAAAAMAVTITLLAACGTGGDDGSGEEDKSLTLMFWNSGSHIEGQWRDLADRFIAENPGVTVELSPINGENWGTYLANAAIRIAGGQTPDLIHTAVEGVKFLSSNNLLVPVDDYLANDPEGRELVDGMFGGPLNILTSDDNLWLLPIATNNMVVYYNTDRFAEAGLEPPTADWTFDDFLATAQALTVDENGDGTPEKYGYGWTGTEIFPGILPWVVNSGGNLVTEDKCAPSVDSAPVVEAVSFMHDMIYEHGVSPVPVPSSDVLARFQTGEYAMIGAGGWPVNTFFQNGFSAYDVQLWPSNETYATVHGGNGFATTRAAQNPDLAWEFQKFAAQNFSQRSSIPAVISTAQAWPIEGGPPNQALFAESLEDYPTIPWFPAPAKYSDYEATTLRALQLIFADEVSVEQGLADAQVALETVVTCE